MNVRTNWAILLGVGLNVGASAAVFQSGPNGKPMHWNMDFYDASLFPDQNPQTLAIRYHVASEGWSQANRTRELDSIRAAFALWQGVPGTRVKFEESTSVSGVADVNAQDGVNMVVWLSSNRMINGGTVFFPSGVTAMTVVSGSGSDEIIAEADIVLNRDQPWFTEFDPNRTTGMHVESVVLHEIGHLLGLNHAAVGGATLFWRTAAGIGATAGLSSDDMSGIRSIYPAAGGATGKVSGAVTLNGAGLKGAVVTIEDSGGRVVATELAALEARTNWLTPAGEFRLRVTPLDPSTLTSDGYLVRGQELDTTLTGSLTSRLPDFLPRTNDLPIQAGKTTSRSLAVTAEFRRFA